MATFATVDRARNLLAASANPLWGNDLLVYRALPVIRLARIMAMNLDTILAFFDSSPAVRLLRADQSPFILCFLFRAFREIKRDAGMIAHDDLKLRLVEFQEELHHDAFEVLVGPADRYLVDWTDAGYLQRRLVADSAQPQYQLTRHCEDAIRFVESALSRGGRLIGTESRLRLVIDTLHDLVHGASPDRPRRLAKLQAERDRIDREIQSLSEGAEVTTYHPAQIRERFQTAVGLLKSLQSDFRAVEDHFVEIAREVQRKSRDNLGTRGEILGEALDAEEMLKQQDEGVSFWAFISFLFSPAAQAELRQTIHEVSRLDAISRERSSIDYIRQMVPSLLSEADNVLRRTGQLSQTLRRLLDAHSAQHRQRTAEVLRDIRVLAAKLKAVNNDVDRGNLDSFGFSIEDLPMFTSPIERGFWIPPQAFASNPEAQVIDLRKAEQAGRKLAQLHRLELNQMRRLIETITRQKPSVTMSQLVQLRTPVAGVLELIGWMQIAHEDGHRIDREGSEMIEVSSQQGTIRVQVPLVTFYRTSDESTQVLTKRKPR